MMSKVKYLFIALPFLILGINLNAGQSVQQGKNVVQIEAMASKFGVQDERILISAQEPIPRDCEEILESTLNGVVVTIRLIPMVREIIHLLRPSVIWIMMAVVGR